MPTLTRRRFIELCGTAALLTSPAAARGLRLLPATAEGTYLPWDNLAPGVHATVDQALGGNSMVITSAGQALLVDTKFPAFAAALAREAAAFGAPITRIINTHHHADHTGGNAVLNEGVEIIAHAAAVERVRSQLDRYTGAAKGGPRQIDMARPTADQVIAEAQAAAEASAAWTADSAAPDTAVSAWPHELTVGDERIVLHHFGAGHTDNDLLVHLPGRNILHTGDLCFNRLHPFFDPEGGATCRGWSAAVAKALDLCDDDTKVVPGHGPLTDRAGLQAQKRYLDALWDHVAKETRSGKPKDDITAMTWDFMDGLGFEQVRARAIGAVYDEVLAAG